jgi:hypothetical protein
MRLALLDSDHQPDAVRGSDLTQPTTRGAPENDGVFHEQPVPGVVTVPDRSRVDPQRCARHERLRKHHEGGAVGSRLRGQRFDLLNCRATVISTYDA